MAMAVREQELTEVLKAPSFGHVAVKKPSALRAQNEGANDEAEVRDVLVGHERVRANTDSSLSSCKP